MPWRRPASVSLLLIAACSTPDPIPPPGDAVVYVAERGWHTDITLPVEEITGPLAILEQDFPGVRFLTFGFGERQFLVDRGKSFLGMLHALLPSRSALLLTALRASPAEAFGPSNVVALRISQTGLQRIEASLWQEFENGPTPLADGPYPGSVFYAASDTYSALFTCNTWTADMLRTGGLPMTVTGVLFAGQVMGMARWIASRQSSPPG
jgi:hypothetical protein